MQPGVKAEYQFPHEGGSVRCELCPNSCIIPDGGRGICSVRVNREGILFADGYGIYPAVHMDPIEKKPLNHFLPGSSILSVGSVGCNLRCLHCQNHSLARGSPSGLEDSRTSPKEMVVMSMKRGSVGIAFTYNEPTVNFEYLMDVLPVLRGSGARVVMVTNGHLSPEPWKRVMSMTDGANIDVKGFTEEFYMDVAGGSLRPVLENVKAAFDMGVHVELTYLVIPGRNDDGDQVAGFLQWARDSLSTSVPLHFTRFHPDHMMTDVPPTPIETLERIREEAVDSGHEHVYIGNVWGDGFNDTVCPGCGKVLINRDGYSTRVKGFKDGICSNCKREIYGVWK